MNTGKDKNVNICYNKIIPDYLGIWPLFGPHHFLYHFSVCGCNYLLNQQLQWKTETHHLLVSLPTQ